MSPVSETALLWGRSVLAVQQENQRRRGRRWTIVVRTWDAGKRNATRNVLAVLGVCSVCWVATGQQCNRPTGGDGKRRKRAFLLCTFHSLPPPPGDCRTAVQNPLHHPLVRDMSVLCGATAAARASCASWLCILLSYSFSQTQRSRPGVLLLPARPRTLLPIRRHICASLGTLLSLPHSPFSFPFI